MQARSFSLHSHIEQCCSEALVHLKKILFSHLLFHSLMVFAIAIQLVMLFFLYNFFPSSGYIALSIAVLIFSFFSYLIFSYYVSAKKPEQLALLKESFLEECLKTITPYQKQEQILSTSLFVFINALENNNHAWKPLQRMPFLKDIAETLIWRDQHMLQEFLMVSIIEIQTAEIKKQPLNILSHNLLAKTYIAMSKIYKNPKLLPIFKIHLQQQYQLQFEQITKLAIEELKIIDRLSPNDPWVQAQLAFCFRNLNMTEEEILQYEKLSQLRPGDENVLFRLGKLYFEMNQHAQALMIYERLFHIDPAKATKLIDIYDNGIKRVFPSI